MGQVGEINKGISKKYKHILQARELIDDALDLDKRMKRVMDNLKQFEKDIDPFREKQQSKIRDFRK